MKALRIITIIIFILVAMLNVGVNAYYDQYVDRQNPVISCDSDTVEVSVTDDESALLAGITATDDRDGDITHQVMVQGVGQLIDNNTAKVSYVVFDSSNNMATYSRFVRYTDYEKPRFKLDAPLVFAVDADLGTDNPSTMLTAGLSASCVLDGDISNRIRLTSQNIQYYTPGVYDATFQVSNTMSDNAVLKVKVVISNYAAANQLIKLREYAAYIAQGSAFNPTDYIMTVRAPASKDSITIESNVDTQTPGNYYVCYSYETASGTSMAYLAVVVY